VQAVAAHRGRPPKAGERYPSGQLKPEIPPALLVRIRAGVERGYLDARLGSQVGRLLFHRELTPAEAAAAFRIGEIYGRFERNNGLPRSTRSPSYEMGNAGGGGQSLDAETIQRIAADAETWEALQDELKNYPSRLCNLIEALCVEDEAVSFLELPELRKVLRKLGDFFNKGKPKKKKKGKKKPALMLVGPNHSAAPPAPKPRRSDRERLAWIAVQRKLRPDLDDGQLAKAFNIYVAMKERADFNESHNIAPPEPAAAQIPAVPFQQTLTLPTPER